MSKPALISSPRAVLWACVSLMAALAACSDSGGPVGTGSGAGDDGDEPIGSGSGAGDEIVNQRIAEDIATLTPFEGIYDLTGNWRGDEGDVAYLLIRSPADDAVSEAVLRDIDDVDTCSERARFGTLVVDDAGGNRDVFLNELLDLENGVASLTPDGSLSLAYRDNGDANGNGNRSERITLTAPRIDASEQDLLPPDC